MDSFFSQPASSGLNDSLLESSNQAPVANRVYHCNLHGDISLHPLATAIMNTPIFKRLQQTKQLSLAKHVYGTASHSRYEHCVGVCYLTTRLVSTLMLHADDEIKASATEEDKLCIMLAALCHDLGHGPYSHSWDSEVVDQDPSWSHEQGSAMLLDEILKTEPKVKKLFDQYGITEDHIEFIKELICNEKSVFEKEWPFRARSESFAWMYMIVSNHSTFVDMDRADYFQRDAVMCGIPDSAKTTIARYIGLARIKTDPVTNRPIIAAPEKVLTDLLKDFFGKRVEMHKKVYQHRAVKTFETMLKDMLKSAQDIYKDILGSVYPQLRNMHKYPHFYSKLSEDGINMLIDHTEYATKDIKDKYEKARELRQRIDRRECYPVLCASRSLPPWWNSSENDVTGNMKSHEHFIDFLAAKIRHEDFQDLVKEGMFEVFRANFNYGNGKENPMKGFRYFTKGDEQVCVVSDNFDEIDPTAIPGVFKSLQFTFYYKGMAEDEIDEEVLKQIKQEFHDYFKKPQKELI